MSQFRVGQRVRIARDLCGDTPELVGLESVVVGIGTIDLGDGFEIELAITDESAFHPDELEPVVPSGHRTGDYTFRELMDRLKAGEVECV
jgi:hypothetical protein